MYSTLAVVLIVLYIIWYNHVTDNARKIGPKNLNTTGHSEVDSKYIDDFLDKEYLFNNKQEYLISKHFVDLKFKVHIRDKVCQACNYHKKLEVHHIVYTNIGNEPLKDLILVCRDCHQAIHDKYGYSYGGYFPIIKKGVYSA